METILLVDDDKFLLDIYTKKLKNVGFNVTSLTEFEDDFVAHVLKIKPDMIISDIMRPKHNGLDVLKVLKHDQRTKDVPFVVFSNSLTEDSIKKSLKLGAAVALVKADITPSQFVDKIKECFNKPATNVLHSTVKSPQVHKVKTDINSTSAEKEETIGFLNGFFSEFFNEPDFDIVVFTFHIIVIGIIIGAFTVLWYWFH